jgi:sugar-phosphatase
MVIEALIFDMDGVLIDSEHLWRKAMIKGFAEFGMPVTEDECRSTMGMRFKEVILLWQKHFKKWEISPEEIDARVTFLLIELIRSEGVFIPGIPEIIEICEKKNLKMGLATSSSEKLMKEVLKKLGLEKRLHVTTSAERMKHGKPHPEVFLICAEQLGVAPVNCLVIEDSLNGVIAAKAAQMKVIAVPDDEHTAMQQFALADYKVNKMFEVPELISMILSTPTLSIKH